MQSSSLQTDLAKFRHKQHAEQWQQVNVQTIKNSPIWEDQAAALQAQVEKWVEQCVQNSMRILKSNLCEAIVESNRKPEDTLNGIIEKLGKMHFQQEQSEAATRAGQAD